MWRTLRKAETGEILLPKARWCASYLCRLRGLMFRLSLPPEEGLLFVNRSPSVINATIHMLFMFFPIAVIWLDAQGRVVDKRYAKPWRLAYAPAAPAQYYLEAHPDLLERVQVGEVLRFD